MTDKLPALLNSWPGRVAIGCLLVSIFHFDIYEIPEFGRIYSPVVLPLFELGLTDVTWLMNPILYAYLPLLGGGVAYLFTRPNGKWMGTIALIAALVAAWVCSEILQDRLEEMLQPILQQQLNDMMQMGFSDIEGITESLSQVAEQLDKK